MSPIIGVIDSQKSGHLWAPAGAYEPIASITLTGTDVTSVTFDSIPQNYSHLQVRMIASNSGNNDLYVTVNRDTTSANYQASVLYGNATTVTSSLYNYGAYYIGFCAYSSTYFGTYNFEILDYTNTNKYKTLRGLFGYSTSGAANAFVGQTTGLWSSTAAITSLKIFSTAGGFTWAAKSSFALYGIKGN